MSQDTSHALGRGHLHSNRQLAGSSAHSINYYKRLSRLVATQYEFTISNWKKYLEPLGMAHLYSKIQLNVFSHYIRGPPNLIGSLAFHFLFILLLTFTWLNYFQLSLQISWFTQFLYVSAYFAYDLLFLVDLGHFRTREWFNIWNLRLYSLDVTPCNVIGDWRGVPEENNLLFDIDSFHTILWRVCRN